MSRSNGSHDANKPFSDKSSEKKGQDGESKTIKYLEKIGEDYIHLAQAGDNSAPMIWTEEWGKLRSPDFLCFDRERFKEKKTRDYAPNLTNLNEPHVYVRQDRMDDYIKLAKSKMPVVLAIYNDEESETYWQYVTELEEKSNHDKVAEDKKTVSADSYEDKDEHEVYWFPVDEFNVRF